MSTTKPGQMGQTRATALSRESDVREKTRESARCFFNDLSEKEKRGAGVEVQVQLLWAR
jgi:hypothetical protein